MSNQPDRPSVGRLTSESCGVNSHSERYFNSMVWKCRLKRLYKAGVWVSGWGLRKRASCGLLTFFHRALRQREREGCDVPTMYAGTSSRRLPETRLLLILSCTAPVSLAISERRPTLTDWDGSRGSNMDDDTGEGFVGTLTATDKHKVGLHRATRINL